MFQHFIITRFNLRTNEFDGASKGGVSEEWMDNRLQIFQDFCLSSVSKQKNQNFTWLVFFDETTSENHVRLITQLAKDYPNFTPVYVDGMENFYSGIKKEIQERIEKEYVITSRLDNDDCLNEDYIESVQQVFNKQEFLVVDFLNGLTLKINGEIKCGYRIHAYNPFISLIESTANELKTIWGRSHGGWGKIKLIKQINNSNPLWMSIVHNENVLNRYIGFDDVTDNTILSFNIENKVTNFILKNRIPNKKLSSIQFKLIASTRFYLKYIRNNCRAFFNLIPDK